MTEEQVRDVLARVVPEPPDSVADASPVVRTARRQRRVRVTGAGVLAAVVIAGAAFGVSSLGADDDKDLVADDSIADPYTTAPCPDAEVTWPTGAVDLSQVTAVRYCARSAIADFTVAEGPSDALVTDLDAFTNTARDLLPADPARCAAADPIPTDSRLLLQLAQGGYVAVPAGLCQDAEIEGITIDGADLTGAFLDALRTQRDDHSYAPAEVTAPTDCMTSGASPATPRSEHLVAAIACTGSGVLRAVSIAADETARLDEAWRTASDGTANCGDPGLAPTTILARSDRGDLVRLDPMGCGQYTYYSSTQTAYLVTFTYEDHTGGS